MPYQLQLDVGPKIDTPGYNINLLQITYASLKYYQIICFTDTGDGKTSLDHTILSLCLSLFYFWHLNDFSSTLKLVELVMTKLSTILEALT